MCPFVSNRAGTNICSICKHISIPAQWRGKFAYSWLIPSIDWFLQPKEKNLRTKKIGKPPSLRFSPLDPIQSSLIPQPCDCHSESTERTCCLFILTRKSKYSAMGINLHLKLCHHCHREFCSTWKTFAHFLSLSIWYWFWNPKISIKYYPGVYRIQLCYAFNLVSLFFCGSAGMHIWTRTVLSYTIWRRWRLKQLAVFDLL